MKRVKKVRYVTRGTCLILATGAYLGSLAWISTITPEILLMAVAVHITELIYTTIYNKGWKNTRWELVDITSSAWQHVVYGNHTKSVWELISNIMRIASWLSLVGIMLYIAGTTKEAVGSFFAMVSTIIIIFCATFPCKNEITIDHWTGHSAANYYGFGR